MKKLILLLLIITCAASSYAQYPITQGLGADSTKVDGRGAIQSRFINKVFFDTTAANQQRIKQYPGAQIFTSSNNQFCYRNATATQWICVSTGLNSVPPSVVTIINDNSISICNVNSCDTFVVNVTAQTINIQNDSTIIICSYGGSCDTINISPTPLIPSRVFVDSIYSLPAAKTDTLVYNNNGDSIHVKVYDRNCGLIDGGIVAYDTLLRFDISPAIYILCSDGIRRTSIQTEVTLAAAHATLDRFDAIILNSTGVTVITGTPAATPEQPQINADQILLTYILVPAAAVTIPACATPDITIYDENVEWTTSTVTVIVDFNSTTTPYRFAKAANVGSFAAGYSFSFTTPTPITVRSYTSLKFFIKLKTTLNPQAIIGVNWVTSAGTASVPLSHGSYGFDRNNTSSYQAITIPISAFAAPNAGTALQLSIASTVSLKFTLAANATAGFYIDYIVLGGSCITQPPSPTPTTRDNSFGIVNTSSGSATSTQPTDILTVTAAGTGVAVSATGKTLTITGSGITDVTANNGLTENVANNIQWGGTLIQNTTINGGTSFHTIFTSSKSVANTATVNIDNTNVGGTALRVTSVSAEAIRAISAGTVAYFMNTTDIATGTQEIMNFESAPSTLTPTDGYGMKINFNLKSSTAVQVANQFISKWTTAANATRTSQFIIRGVNSGTEVDKLYIGGAATQINATRFETYQGAAVAAANDLTLGTDGNVFSITGATQINAITTANWQAGSVISLIFASTPTVKHNTAGGAGTAPLLLAGGIDFVAGANDVLNLVYNGTSWYETSRKVSASAGLTSITADNGITANTSSNVQLGSLNSSGVPLAANRWINTNGFQLIVSAASGTSAPFAVVNNNASGQGVTIETNYIGLSSTGTNIPLWAINNSAVNNTVVTALQINRTGVNGANGIGSHIKFQMLSSTGAQGNSGEIVNKYTNATNGSQVSRFDFNLANGGTTSGLKFAIWGEGAIRLEPITAAAASAITPVEGLILFVSDTDATFVSIGLWCYQNSAWKAL